MSDVNRNKLRALATGCRDEVIRSHGWEGTIEEAELIARDRRLLMELSPEVVIQLLDDYDALQAEREQLRAELAAIRGRPSAELIEAVRELIGAANSVNRSRMHEVRGHDDDQPRYWQRKEWVDWLIENGEKAQQALEALQNQQAQVVGRVHHNEEHAEPVRAVLNSIGRELPDDSPLYSLPLPPSDASRGQEPVVEVSEETFSSDGTSDIITAKLKIGTKLYALPPQQADAVSDTARLDFMIQRDRKLIVERLPGKKLEIYVEEGFMGDKKYSAVKHKGDWNGTSVEAAALKRKAIDIALLSTRQVEEGRDVEGPN